MREAFLEEAFLLQYHLNMSYSDVRSMPLPYRKWFIRRISDEFKQQADARKKASDNRSGLVDIPMGDIHEQLGISPTSDMSPGQGRDIKFDNG